MLETDFTLSRFFCLTPEASTPEALAGPGEAPSLGVPEPVVLTAVLSPEAPAEAPAPKAPAAIVEVQAPEVPAEANAPEEPAEALEALGYPPGYSISDVDTAEP